MTSRKVNGDVLLVIVFGCSLFGSEPNTLQIYSALFGPIIPYPPYPRTRMVTTSKGSTFQNLSYAPIDSARRELSNAYMKSLFRHPPSKSVFSVAEKTLPSPYFYPQFLFGSEPNTPKFYSALFGYSRAEPKKLTRIRVSIRYRFDFGRIDTKMRIDSESNRIGRIWSKSIFKTNRFSETE